MARTLTFLFFLSIAIPLGFTAVSLGSRGHPVTLPLDDAYIYLQYARAAAAGAPGSYFPGEPPSAGATSPLWTALIAAAAAALPRAGDHALPAAALAFCALAAAAALTLAYRLARRHGAGVTGALAAPAALLLTPAWLFGSFNGMETGLYGAALLGAAFALGGASCWWLLPLALTRPEGAGLALVILAVSAIRRRREAPADADPVTARSLAPGALVVAAALFTLALPWLLTAGPSGAWVSKALGTEPRPDVRGFYLPRLPYFALRILWFGVSGGRTQPPLDVGADLLRPDAWATWIWALFLGGGSLAALAGRRARGPLLLWVVASLAALAGVAWDAHRYRYLIPAYPLLAVAATAGWFGSTWRPHADRVRAGLREAALPWRRVPRGRAPGHLWRFLAGGLLWIGVLAGAWSAPTGPRALSRRLYRADCERLANTQAVTGDWIRDHLPAEARVATHDVGAIAFRGGRPVTDLVGLVSPALGNAYRHGEGALWEALDALPPERRPTHAAVIPAWMPYLSRTFWFGQRLWTAGSGGARRVPVGRDFEVRRLSWPADDRETWPGGDLGNIPALHGHATREVGWSLVDALDVADLVSERSHDYHAGGPPSETLVRDLGFATRMMPAARAHAMEGGREVTGPVRFTLRLRPDRRPGVDGGGESGRGSARHAGDEALLVLRCASSRECDLTVRVGKWSRTLRVPRGEGVFAEPALLLPPAALAQADNGRLTITVEGSGYTAFHWWLLAGI